MATKMHYWRGEHSIEVSKRVQTEDGRGFKTVPAGTRSGELLVEINLTDIIQHLGSKALRSTRGRSIGLSGAVKVKVTKRL